MKLSRATISLEELCWTCRILAEYERDHGLDYVVSGLIRKIEQVVGPLGEAVTHYELSESRRCNHGLEVLDNYDWYDGYLASPDDLEGVL